MWWEALANHHIRNRNQDVTFLECDGITTAVTSWIVHTTGTIPRGRTLTVGANSRSALARAAARLAPPNRHRRSRASRLVSATSNPDSGPMQFASLAAPAEVNKQKLISGRLLAICLNWVIRFRA